VAVETLKILLTIALVTPLIPITLLVGNHMYYYIDLATTSQRLPSRPEDLSRPIIGGVQIQVVPEFCSRNGDLISILYCLFIARTCTAGYAVRVNRTVGFISAGHCADFSSGFHVYQPIYLPPICYLQIIPGLPPRIKWVCIPAPTFAGVVTWASREYDAMFVKFSNVTHLILHIEGRWSFHLAIAGIMRHYDVEVGLRVCKTGRTTGTTCGAVFKVGSCDVEGNIVPRCIYVWARAAPGDSGSPLYFHYDIVFDSRVIPAATLLGHVIGGNETLRILVASSITNILESGFTLHRG
jgi:hypothetical protein